LEQRNVVGVSDLKKLGCRFYVIRLAEGVENADLFDMHVLFFVCKNGKTSPTASVVKLNFGYAYPIAAHSDVGT
jgi:hypothetical protein